MEKTERGNKSSRMGGGGEKREEYLPELLMALWSPLGGKTRKENTGIEHILASFRKRKGTLSVFGKPEGNAGGSTGIASASKKKEKEI